MRTTIRKGDSLRYSVYLLYLVQKYKHLTTEELRSYSNADEQFLSPFQTIKNNRNKVPGLVSYINHKSALLRP